MFDDLVTAAPTGTNKPEEYFKTNGGVAILDNFKQEAANNLFDQLDAYGFFVVRQGEVESWLTSPNISKNKKTWRREIFKAMGSDPSHTDYIKPATGDVWDFIGNLRKWLTALDRKGLALEARGAEVGRQQSGEAA